MLDLVLSGPRTIQRAAMAASRVLLGHVSIWKIAIKHALARADMPLSAAQAIQWADEYGFKLLQLKLGHLLTLELLR